MPTVPELKARCKEVGLSTKNNKAEMERQLLNPDDYRVMVGTVSLKVTNDLSIEHLQIIKNKYLSIGHPSKDTKDAWKIALGITINDFKLYAIAQFLGSKQGPSPNAFPGSSSSPSTSSSSSSQTGSSTSKKRKVNGAAASSKSKKSKISSNNTVASTSAAACNP